MNKRKTGTDYETMAVDYLVKSGYRILERNYRSRRGEVDIIAFYEGVLVIAEVKYRADDRCGEPEEAVDLRKQRTICRVTMDYLMRHKHFYNRPCRFDVISICGNGSIRHTENAFDFGI